MTDPQHDAAVMPLLPTEPGILQSYDPTQLKRDLADQFNHAVTALRQARGTVTRPEDVHDAVRRIHTVRDRAQAFSGAFKALADSAGQVLEEELVEAVGEKDGVPNRSMSVPTGDGQTIRLSPNYTTRYDTDLAQGIATVVALVDDEWRSDQRDPAADYAGFAIEVTERSINGLLRKTEAAVTGFDALAAELGHRGLDHVAAAARDAKGKKTRVYRGVKVEVNTPDRKTS